MDTKIRVEITKMIVPTPQSKQTSRQTAPPLKIKSHRIKLKIGIGTNSSTTMSKITIPRRENNENHTPARTKW